MLATIINSSAHTPYEPSVWDWIAFVALETQCALFLLSPLYWLPLSDWLMRGQIRKETLYRHKLAKRKTDRRARRYEPVGRSKWWGRN